MPLAGTVAAVDTAQASAAKPGPGPDPRIYNLGNTHPVNVTTFVTTLEQHLGGARCSLSHRPCGRPRPRSQRTAWPFPAFKGTRVARPCCGVHWRFNVVRAIAQHPPLRPVAAFTSRNACAQTTVSAVKEYVAVPGTGDVLFTHADVSRARAELGYAPATPLAVGLGKFVAWFQEYYKDGAHAADLDHVPMR